MVNLATHYKERAPEETIQIIKNFFTKQNYTIQQVYSEQTESGTWHCRIELFKDNINLGATNGKGITESYCLASGYAELYERFCNKTFFMASPYWIKSYLDENFKTNQYYFSPDEKILTYEEVINCPRISEYFNIIADNNTDFAKAAIDYITDELYIGVPMYNIINNEQLYIDPRLLFRLERTNGMAAGNTVEEALIQGCSEVVERLVSETFIYKDSHVSMPHYALKLDTITDSNLRSIIDKIQSIGYDLYIFDLSYNYKLPVLMSVLLDRKNGTIRINFGSFPVFNIAAERILTELYQGHSSMRDTRQSSLLQIPYKSMDAERTLMIYNVNISGRILPIDFFKNIKWVENYNKEIFVDTNINTQELITYYQKLSQDRNIQFYYMNNSLSDKMAAIFVMADSNGQYKHMPMYYCDFTKDNIAIQQCYQLLNLLKTFYNDLYYKKPINLLKLIEFIQTYDLKDSVRKTLYPIILWNGIFIAERPECNTFELLIPLLQILDYEFTTFSSDLINSELYFSYKKYIQLAQYVKCNRYSVDELLHIFNDIFDYQITEDDINKCHSPAYLLQKIYIEPFYSYVNSDSFKTLIQTFIKGE